MGAIRAFGRGIEIINTWIGNWAGLGFVFIMGLVTMDVLLRYIFNRPTTWSWDVNVQLMAGLVTIGGGFLLIQKGHVAVDVLTMRMSARSRAVMELAMTMLFFLGVGILFWQLALEAWSSLIEREVYPSVLRSPIYPLKMVMALGVLLLLLQGVVIFVRKLTALLSGRCEEANR